MVRSHSLLVEVHRIFLVAIVLLGTHGWVRVQIKRFRHGQVRPIPAALTLVVLVAAAAIIALGANPTLLTPAIDWLAQIGFGYDYGAASTYKHYWVQNFGRPR